MLFTLEVLPAAEGDCLLLHWKSGDNPRIALIDGGPRGIYDEQLRGRLDDIVANLGVQQLALELVMVSHMDGDHIIGIMELLRDLKREVEDQLPNRPLRVKRLWLNVFNDILGDAIDKYYKKMTASLQASVDGGKPNPELVDKLTEQFISRQNEPPQEALEDAWAVSLVLAAHGDGRNVRDDHKYLFEQNQTAALNSPFQDNQGRPTLITLEKTPDPTTIAGLKVRIIGPMWDEIKALQEEFDAYIAKNGLTVEAVLAAYADKSVKNLSSIVCIAALGEKQILFTGDARGDKIIKGLVKAGLLQEEGGPPLFVDILKVPHHGSDRNVTKGFFQRLTADMYVLSGDGQNGNPDRATLEWIIESRGADAEFDIILTYSVDEIDETRRAYFKKRNMQWDDDEDSLAALFARTTAEGYAFTLKAGAPVTCDLGDETIDW
ncbi:MAG TPA: hypothetical protein VEO54_29365 [Thermoanaerobaculia bacterium]|nr:hypothetical protein [Thermoanaerobaculia bacterium]